MVLFGSQTLARLPATTQLVPAPAGHESSVKLGSDDPAVTGTLPFTPDMPVLNTTQGGELPTVTVWLHVAVLPHGSVANQVRVMINGQMLLV